MARTTTDPLRGFVSIFSASVGTLIVALLVTPLLTRILGSAGYGDYAFIMSILSVLIIVVNGGIFDGMRKYIAEYPTDPRQQLEIFGFYVRVGFLLTFAATALLLVAIRTGTVERIFGPAFVTYFHVLIALLVVRQGFLLLRSALFGLGLERSVEPLMVVQMVLFAVLGTGLAYVGYGVVGVLVGQAVAFAVVSIAAGYALSRRMNLRVVLEAAPSGLQRDELLRYNSLTVVLITLTISLYHVDVLLLLPLAGSEQVGYYRAALVIAEFVWFVPVAAQTVLLHSSSEMWARGEYDRISLVASRVLRFVAIITVLISIGIAALASRFVPLYLGSEFHASVTPLLLLLPGALGFALARPIYAIGQGKGELRMLITATGTAALLNLALNLLLIPRYGMNGAAVATSIGYGSMVVLHVATARRIGFDPLLDLRLSRIAAATALAAPIIVGIALAIPGDVAALLFVPPVGFFTYMYLVFRFGALDQTECAPVIELLPAPIDALAERMVRFVT